jgi:hypothetical protein
MILNICDSLLSGCMKLVARMLHGCKDNQLRFGRKERMPNACMDIRGNGRDLVWGCLGRDDRYLCRLDPVDPLNFMRVTRSNRHY